MYTDMENWAEIRRRVLADGLSERAACREYGIHWKTLKKILDPPRAARLPPHQPQRPSILEPLLPVVHQILEDDRKAPKKQRHTAKRIFRAAPGRARLPGRPDRRQGRRPGLAAQHAEVFVPLAHPPGEAQADFGQAEVILDGRPTKVAVFVMTLPYSDAIFACAFPRECTEAFLEGHVRAFAFFGGVPRRISYDNPKIAVAKITGSRRPQAHRRVPPAEEPPPLRGALLPGPAAQREGARRDAGRLRPPQLPRARAPACTAAWRGSTPGSRPTAAPTWRGGCGASRRPRPSCWPRSGRRCCRTSCLRDRRRRPDPLDRYRRRPRLRHRRENRLPKPRLPVTVTVGGLPAAVAFSAYRRVRRCHPGELHRSLRRRRRVPNR